nr:hypothetical protein BaRGS_002073 [Batillaria attramentaria]KAG5711500.1 hypothetical protein BaRGS_025927 [Batillaria attramentaria]
MNCLVFIIPPESGERISFLISIFISNTVFSSYVNGIMPRGLGTEVPLLMGYVIGMWTMSIVNFLATVAVMRRFHHEQKVDARHDESQESRMGKKSALFGILDSLRLGKCLKNRVSGSTVSIFDPHEQASSDDHPASLKPEQHRDQLDEIKLPEETMVDRKDECGEHNRSFISQANENSQRASTRCLTAKQLDLIFLVISLVIVAAGITSMCTIMVNEP